MSLASSSYFSVSKSKSFAIHYISFSNTSFFWFQLRHIFKTFSTQRNCSARFLFHFFPSVRLISIFTHPLSYLVERGHFFQELWSHTFGRNVNQLLTFLTKQKNETQPKFWKRSITQFSKSKTTPNWRLLKSIQLSGPLRTRTFDSNPAGVDTIQIPFVIWNNLGMERFPSHAYVVQAYHTCIFLL